MKDWKKDEIVIAACEKQVGDYGVDMFAELSVVQFITPRMPLDWVERSLRRLAKRGRLVVDCEHFGYTLYKLP